MTRQPWHAAATALLLFLVTSTARAHWNDQCKDGGQCAAMIRGYETLIEGEGCRSFYTTGLCSRLCTYSLKSLIGRKTWTKCARRCEWASAVTDAASSWLDLCLSRPAPDVAHPQVEQPPSVPSMPKPVHMDAAPAQAKPTSRSWMSCILISAVVLAVLAVASGLNGGHFRLVVERVSRAMPKFRDNLISLGGSRVSGRGRGVLDGAPSRPEFKSMQRGARRHLKAVRSTLD